MAARRSREPGRATVGLAAGRPPCATDKGVNAISFYRGGKPALESFIAPSWNDYSRLRVGMLGYSSTGWVGRGLEARAGGHRLVVVSRHPRAPPSPVCNWVLRMSPPVLGESQETREADLEVGIEAQPYAEREYRADQTDARWVAERCRK